MFFFPMGNLKACHDQISIKTQSRPDSPNHNLVDGYALPGTVTSFKMNVVMNFTASSADKLSYLNRI